MDNKIIETFDVWFIKGETDEFGDTYRHNERYERRKFASGVSATEAMGMCSSLEAIQFNLKAHAEGLVPSVFWTAHEEDGLSDEKDPMHGTI